jgi:ubiquinone/menaquinone biosynthesis C-methylase UbiE
MQNGLEGQNCRSSLARYVFANEGERAEFRYRDLSTLYDSQTVTHLTKLGVDTGWSCLEVGAGGGSIAAWLCERVGKSGCVLATDIELCFLLMLPFGNLQVRRHDVRMGGLPKREFDLVHARLVLMHLPGRELALERMIEAVKPGGWIVVEEFDVFVDFSGRCYLPCRGTAQDNPRFLSSYDQPRGRNAVRSPITSPT